MPFIYANRRLLAFLHDVAVAAISFWLALYLRVSGDFGVLPADAAVWATLLFTATCAAVFWAQGLYRSIWAFASLRDLIEILRSATLAVALFLVLAFITIRLEGVPRTVPFMAWFIMLAGLGGSRMLFRLLRERRLSALWERSGAGRVNVLLIGAGDEADIFLRAIGANPHAAYHVVGILGENDKRVGRTIHGVSVVGTVDQLPAIIAKLRDEMKAPSRLILTRAVSRFNSSLVTQLLEQSAALGLSLSRLPALTDLRDDVATALTVRDQPLALEDLLGRPETKLNRSDIRALIKGRRVLVTGAGGTIGSELVRQIAALEPSHLTLVEFSEFNLYRIDMEVKETFPYQTLHSLIGDVRDAARMGQIFAECKPDLVFHAAAIKHVPIAEENIREAILTNVVGTRIVADCCLKSGLAAMVLISTDKAVHPSSVMGATKRLAEMYCQALDLSSNATRFITVRFGNVLGSTGSVVPRFQEQLAKGGPLTVTHPDITRYFMTVREAVELVLQASALGAHPGDQRGKVLVLDMGEPVKIADLARQMIRLAGLRPDEDIKITYTGLRPGEKLHEELFADAEELIPSAADGVKLGKATTVELPFLQEELNGYDTRLRQGLDEDQSVAKLSALVPEFKRPQEALQKVG
ncbi:MAG: nucleoside-diphosphate sugar epimerase/dehydratase [Alphaproteobacteria bacterium]|nr:nucleoside-diphosphate sugar epimerase/dehydratase [Alphaproteobacteria bacterium]